MRSIEDARVLIESLLELQEDPGDGPSFPCPRCGHDRMNSVAELNALSRRANVYICAECGRDEAMRDVAGAAPIPLNEWGMVLGFDENEDDEWDE